MEIVENRKDEVYATIDGRKKVVPKSILNMDWSREQEVVTTRYSNDNNYNAFPNSLTLGTYIYTVFSSGTAHAQSTHQVMTRGSKSSDSKVFKKVIFFDEDTGLFDTSLLEGVLPDGESIVFKVWTITNNGGVLSVITTSTVNVSGLDYALWGDVVGTGGNLYRTGYSYVSGNYNTAMFKSTDEGRTWAIAGVIASGTGAGDHIYNEAGLFYEGSGDFIAIIRDDDNSIADGALYYSKSLDYGVTWSTPTILTDSNGEHIRGRQPKLTRVTIGGAATFMALTIGKRNGNSGSYGGEEIYYGDRTGVQLWISSDYGETEAGWGESTMIDGMYSTDGGQPWAVWNSTTNKLFIPYYARKSIEELPDIYTMSLSVEGLEK